MKRILIVVAFLLLAGVSFGQMKDLPMVKSITTVKPQPLPAYYQKYIEWVITSNQHAAPISPEVLFHRQQTDVPAIKWINIAGRLKLQYAEHGNSSGVPVILLHGFTDSWRSYESVTKYKIDINE